MLPNPTPTGDNNEPNKYQTTADNAVGSDRITVGKIVNSEAVAIGREAIATSIKNFFLGEREDVIHLRNRQTMLQLVKSTWIKDVLEQSLHNAVLINLDMETRVDAVEYPWDMIIRRDNQDDEPFPEGTQIVDVFDQMNQSLLILGAPGSGKTTMLLELARQLISRAEQDPTLPIPVVFNLSSWAEKRQPLAEWLVDEFNVKYHIPKKVAQRWVEDDELLLLLDGLDEVQQEHREACVNAVNVFRQDHLVPLTICSRTVEYKALNTQLKLDGAIVLLPLNEQQIDNYLKSVGDRLQAVQIMLEQDAILQEFVQSPLTLSIMTLAYQDKSIEELQVMESVDARREHLFNAYISKMFTRTARNLTELYSKDQTIRWLQWLASRLLEHRQTVFLIEQMQPNWAQSTKRSRFTTAATMLVWGPIYGVIFGLFGGLLFGLCGGLLMGLLDGLMTGWSNNELSLYLMRNVSYGLEVGPRLGLYLGLMLALVEGFGGRFKEIKLSQQSDVFWQKIRSAVYSTLFWMLLFWLSAKLVYGRHNVVVYLDVLFFGLAGAVIGGFREFQLANPLELSRSRLKFHLISGLLVGLIGTLLDGLLGGLTFGLLIGPIIGLLGGLLSALIFKPSTNMEVSSVFDKQKARQLITRKRDTFTKNLKN